MLRGNLEKEGVAWKDAAIAGGGGDQARTVLQARMAAGDPPTAMQMLGLVIQDWAEQGALGDLTPLAEKDGWDKVIPPALQASTSMTATMWRHRSTCTRPTGSG